MWSFGLLRSGNKLIGMDMVKKEIKFSDGTRIFYEEENGSMQRFIEYGYSPFQKGQIEKYPQLKSRFDEMVMKRNCGKFNYLQEIEDIARKLNDSQRQQLYNELKELHDKVGQEYDPNIINKDFLGTFGKYWQQNNDVQCAAFFATIYLAMLDLEQDKEKYPRSLGKTMVLKSCEAVILKNVDYREAATMFERKKETISNDYDYSESESRYEKYNGYNGYDDDTIDDGFDGHPEATWNVD